MISLRAVRLSDGRNAAAALGTLLIVGRPHRMATIREELEQRERENLRPRG